MKLELTLIIFLAIWLIVISLIFFWYLYRFNNLVKDEKGAKLFQILDKILKSQKGNKENIKEIAKQFDVLDETSKNFVQKIGLVRFNPFSETGGDHSFSIALLDGKNTGFVLTGLHTRERTRLYIKPVNKGKSQYDLSDEEKKAIDKAQKEKR